MRIVEEKGDIAIALPLTLLQIADSGGTPERMPRTYERAHSSGAKALRVAIVGFGECFES